MDNRQFRLYCVIFDFVSLECELWIPVGLFRLNWVNFALWSAPFLLLALENGKMQQSVLSTLHRGGMGQNVYSQWFFFQPLRPSSLQGAFCPYSVFSPSPQSSVPSLKCLLDFRFKSYSCSWGNEVELLLCQKIPAYFYECSLMSPRGMGVGWKGWLRLQYS